MSVPSLLDDVIARRVLRVCTPGPYQAYSFLRAGGRFEGVDIDLGNGDSPDTRSKAGVRRPSVSDALFRQAFDK